MLKFLLISSIFGRNNFLLISSITFSRFSLANCGDAPFTTFILAILFPTGETSTFLVHPLKFCLP